MLIFLYGQDSYRSRQKLNEIIDNYKKIHKSGFSLNYFDSQNLDFQNFKNEVETNSMFKEKKLIVLEDIFLNKNFKEAFLEQGEKFISSDSIILIYERQKINENDSLFKFLQKKAKFQEFKPLEEEKLKSWVKKEFNNYQAEINPEALNELVNFIGNDLWQLANEIKKIVSYTKGKKIKKEDIGLLVKPKIENDIFKTINSLAEKKKSQALDLIHRHLEKGDNPLYLLSMINFQFRNLLEIKNLIEKNIPYYGIFKKTNLHPFVVKKSYWQAQKFTLQQLKKIYQKIFQVDSAIKTGKIESETALDLLISSL